MADVNISKYRASVVRDGSKPASPGFVVSEGQDPVNPPGTNNFVPYTGATANVELGEFGVEAGFVTLDTTPTNIPTDQGAIYWDDTRSTAALIMNGTLQHIGQDSFFYVKNSSGSTIPKGTCVGFAGTDGGSGHLLVTPFLANGSVPSTYFMGVTCESIANGSFGQVMHFGELEGINTSGFTAGALLYASSTVAGAFQTTAPVAPNNIILVAAAVNSKNNGAIVVRPTLGSNINSDEGVKITSPTTGDLLQLQAGGLWENKTLAQVIGSAYVPSTRTLTINGTAFDLSANRSWTVGDVRTDGSYSNPSWITALAWSKITGTPTTLSGYGITDAVPSSRTITINGVTQDLSANRSFNVGTVTSVGLSSATSGVTIGSTPVTSSGTITLAIATASGSQQGLLSASDWTTFNNKQNALTNPVTGTGTTNYLAKFTGSTTVGNSILFESGSSIGIGTITPQIYTNYSVLEINNTTGGAIRVKNTASSGLFELATNSSETYIKNVSNTPMWFGTNNTQMLTLTTSGNVGIGTASPSALLHVGNGNQSPINAAGNKLHIATTSTRSALVTLANSSGGTTVEGQFESSAESSDLRIIVGSTSNHPVVFRASNTEAMRLSTNLNLLVGTTTDAGFRLDVNGSGVFRNTLALQSSGTNAAMLSWTGSNNGLLNLYNGGSLTTQILANGNSYFNGGNVGIGTSSPFARLHVRNSDVNEGTIAIGNDNFPGLIYSNAFTGEFRIDNRSSAGAGYITFYPNGQQNTLGNEAMRIATSRNVLIGTTTDNGARLQVIGFARFDRGTLQFTLNPSYGGGNVYSQLQSTGALALATGGDNNRLYIDTSGNVGIGTSNPQEPLHISTSGADKFIRIENSNSYTGIWMNDSGANNGWLLMSGYTNTTSPGDFAIREYGVQTSLVIKQTSGNLLVGTTSDNGARLQVSGTATVSGRIGSGGSSNTTNAFSGQNNSTAEATIYSFNHNAAGWSIYSAQGINYFANNVGIGTTSPSYKLHINTSGTAENVFGITNGTQTLTLGVNNGSGGSFLFENSNNGLRFGTNGTERMRITSGGNVGINTTSGFNYVSGTETTLSIANGNVASLYLNSTSTGNLFALYSSAVGSLQVYNVTQNNYPLGITSGGNVMIGTTTDSGDRLRVNGSIRTANTTNRTADSWRLADARIDTIPNANRLLRVQIGSVEYDILARQVI